MGIFHCFWQEEQAAQCVMLMHSVPLLGSVDGALFLVVLGVMAS